MPKPITTTYLHPVILLNRVVFQLLSAMLARMMRSLYASYLLPAILLNPCVILHFLINTPISHIDTASYPVSNTHAQWLENLGPVSPAFKAPFFDVHENDGLCWAYTMVMVGAQVLAFGKISATRSARKCTPTVMT